MRLARVWKIASTDLGILVLSALFLVLLHTLTNGQYGFHRDELATIDDARYLSWGYVAYPPLTPFIARLSLTLFGASLTGLRFFAAAAQGIAIVLAGLMARELGGGRPAQLVAAWAAATAPVAFASGAMFQYVSFDHLWWVLAAYFTIRLLKSEDPRWWLAIGVVAGLGLITKYTVAFFLAGMAGGVLLTDARRDLASKWLWCGAAVAVLIFLPNVIWQVQHHFISLDFLRSIHARDVRLGRTDGFLLAQLWKCANVVTLPLWLAGLYWLFGAREAKRYRMIGWMFVIPLALFLVAKGRDYYLAPAYPMLLAAGAVWGERQVGRLPAAKARRARGIVWGMLATSGMLVAVVVLPVAPLNSGWWRATNALNDNFNEEIGWPEMAQAVARVRDSLAGESAALGILAGDAGEAGAINLYGRAWGLPEAISGSNSHWLRGYGDPPPQTVIAAGFRRRDLEAIFQSCELAGSIQMPFGIRNSAIGDRTDIFVCRRPRQPWDLFWRHFRWFG
ncbi:MAG TPA: glycosyltransferase family 39 protein [Bryobacteraceae bacterium]|nr:glycosyltransferase family 39 protein [Bryobacteraceae bacterium]